MPNTFHSPHPRSTSTEIDGNIDAFQTTIPVIDGGALPDGPNVATIGIGPQSETVYYAIKNINLLENCVRGYSPSGSARAWDTGTIIARVLTTQDISAIQNRVVASENNAVVLQSDINTRTPMARIITAGSGLTGGGNLSTNRTVNMGTPATITPATTNEVTDNSHTHATDNIVPDSRAITAGNGLTGGGNLEADREVTMGTPTTLTGDTTNVATANSHAHALNIDKDDVGLSNVTNDAQLAKAGGTMTGVLTAQNNTSYTTKQARNITLSTGDPSGGGNGDVWIKYS